MPEPGHQWSQNQDGGAHLFYQLVGGHRVQQAARLNFHPVTVLLMGHGCIHAQFIHQAAHGSDVANPWYISQNNPLRGQQGRSHGRKGGIFGTADGDLPFERVATGDQKFIHICFQAFGTAGA